MRYVWSDAGDDPDWGKIRAHGINGVFSPMFDPLTPEVLAEAARQGLEVGVYMVSNWPQFQGLTPADIASRCSTEYHTLSLAHPTLKMQFDMEEHLPEKILNVLSGWRLRRKNVNTSWTMEPMQGGWMGPPCPQARSLFVQQIVDVLKVRVVPQLYGGSMQPFNEGHCYTDLYKVGFRAISPFYDAKALPVWWDGFCFTAGRLP